MHQGRYLSSWYTDTWFFRGCIFTLSSHNFLQFAKRVIFLLKLKLGYLLLFISKENSPSSLNHKSYFLLSVVTFCLSVSLWRSGMQRCKQKTTLNSLPNQVIWNWKQNLFIALQNCKQNEAINGNSPWPPCPSSLLHIVAMVYKCKFEALSLI